MQHVARVGRVVVRIEAAQEFRVRGPGVVVALGVIQDPADAAGEAGRLGLQLGRSTGFGQGFVGLAAHGQRAGQIKMKRRILGRQHMLVDALAEDLDRLSKLAGRQHLQPPGERALGGPLGSRSHGQGKILAG